MDQLSSTTMRAVRETGPAAEVITAQVNDYLDAAVLVIDGPAAPLQFTNLKPTPQEFLREHVDAHARHGVTLADGMILWRDHGWRRAFHLPNTIAAKLADQFDGRENPPAAWNGPAVLTGSRDGTAAPLSEAAVAAVVPWLMAVYPYPELIRIR